MKTIWLIIFFLTCNTSCKKNGIQEEIKSPIINTPVMNNDTSSSVKKYTYLALGDSYTIGQNVPAAENYPNQVTELLRKQKLEGKAKIIAVTGWTTDNLENGIKKAEANGELLTSYDIVTLLIGVNNQYQGQPAADYLPKFEASLKRAISFAGNKATHVIVISIPDWGVTPFAGVRDRNKIAAEIDEYNAINAALAARYGTGYLEVTEWTREAAKDPSLLASDGLHPSGKEYARWAEKLSGMMETILR